MPQPILFLGDTSLDTAACYLAGCLSHAGWEFEHFPSQQPIRDEDVKESRQLYIISDFPAVNFSNDLQKQVVRHVQSGSNLLMIGGWESFRGSDGHWNGTPIGDLLPVEMSDEDDRRNCDGPVFVQQTVKHPITTGLPWKERTPHIGGFNRVKRKAEGQVLLTAEVHSAFYSNEAYQLHQQTTDPLLVVQEVGQSRVAAMMADLAPHWIGPMVDWGDQRVSAQAPNAEAIEVGNLYYQFVKQLIGWVGQLD